MTAVLARLHQLDTPCGQCVLCGLRWPCPAERARLVARYGRGPELAEVAFGMLEQAVADDPDRPEAELWDRFIAWTRPAWAAVGR